MFKHGQCEVIEEENSNEDENLNDKESVIEEENVIGEQKVIEEENANVLDLLFEKKIKTLIKGVFCS